MLYHPSFGKIEKLNETIIENKIRAHLFLKSKLGFVKIKYPINIKLNKIHFQKNIADKEKIAIFNIVKSEIIKMLIFLFKKRKTATPSKIKEMNNNGF